MSDFRSFARAHGVEIGELHASSRIQRCGTVEHPRSKNGAYFWDGQRGWAFAWDGEARVHWFEDDKPWTEAEKRAWAARRDEERAARERTHQRAALRAAELIRAAELHPHGYLRLKGFADLPGLVLPDETLVIPMRDLRTNALQGAQLIRWVPEPRQWEKKMVTGMRAKGAVLLRGSRHAGMTILCEGFATGLSIEAAAKQMRLNAAVLVCFSDSNLVHVAPRVRGRAVVFADNDQSGAGERAAQATGLPYCMAPVVGWDANDWHQERGLMEVCAALLSLRELQTT